MSKRCFGKRGKICCVTIIWPTLSGAEVTPTKIAFFTIYVWSICEKTVGDIDRPITSIDNWQLSGNGTFNSHQNKPFNLTPFPYFGSRKHEKTVFALPRIQEKQILCLNEVKSARKYAYIKWSLHDVGTSHPQNYTLLNQTLNNYGLNMSADRL